MMNYTASVFAEAGSVLSPNLSAIIVGMFQLIGCAFSTLLVDKLGRKVILVIIISMYNPRFTNEIN